MELHIVNLAPNAPSCNFLETGDITNCVSVVGIMYTFDDENAENDEELTRIISEATIDENGTPVVIDLQKLLPEDKSYYTYAGSLTTPPCTETLLWHVMTTPMKVSRKTVQAVQKAVTKVNFESRFNSRVTQPLNERNVFLHDAAKWGPVCPDVGYAGDNKKVRRVCDAGEADDEKCKA